MLTDEKGKGVVDWKQGVLILHSTEQFTAEVLPKYFNTRNFKTFRRQLNYYGKVDLYKDPLMNVPFLNMEICRISTS